jgi:selenocysteine lyase/cysteine desulfurase
VGINRRTWLSAAGWLSLGSAIRGRAATASPPRLPDKDNFPVTQNVTELNNARWHPMSTPTMRAVQEYLEYKRQSPLESGDLSTTYTGRMQREVKTMFAQLINAKLSEISFVPSTMVGENLVVAGLDLRRNGGNVVTDALHFEGSTYMYRTLQKQGLDLRVVMPRDWRIDLRDLEKAIDRNTKLVSLSQVSFYNGFQPDLKAVCDLAHAHGAYVYADMVQAAGAIAVDVRVSGVDFCASASYKWLMGDMGLGFFYTREDLLGRVIQRSQYGFRQFTDFEDHMFPFDPPADSPATWKQIEGAGGYFEVGTFSNTTVACLSHSLKYVQQLGVANIQAHSQSMTQRLQKELPRLGYASLTPPDSKSPITTFVVKDPEQTAARLKRAKISVKIAEHQMRISPSVYNDQHDIDKLLNALG